MAGKTREASRETMADFPNGLDVEADWPEREADGEEEPLFADDITDDEEDPPPLPPPMPSLGELSASRQRVNLPDSQNYPSSKVI